MSITYTAVITTTPAEEIGVNILERILSHGTFTRLMLAILSLNVLVGRCTIIGVILVVVQEGCRRKVGFCHSHSTSLQGCL